MLPYATVTPMFAGAYDAHFPELVITSPDSCFITGVMYVQVSTTIWMPRAANFYARPASSSSHRMNRLVFT